MADYVAFSARISSFREGQGRTSAKSRRKAWPHEKPTANELASAGFYFNPSTKYPDNVTCFLCSRSLDGWEPTDDPFKEHSVHCPDCPWVVSIQGSSPSGSQAFQARLATFATSWPHDGKIGWHATSEAMALAGFYFKPSSPDDDTVACTSCGLVLDGWEPKDDPREEHHSRCPDCAIFSQPTKSRTSSRQSKRISTSSTRSSSTTRSVKRSSSLAFSKENEDVANDTDRSDDQLPVKRRTSKRISASTTKRSSTAKKRVSTASETNKATTKRAVRAKKPSAVKRQSSTHDTPAAELVCPEITDVPKIKQEEFPETNRTAPVRNEEQHEAVLPTKAKKENVKKSTSGGSKQQSIPKAKIEQHPEPKSDSTKDVQSSPSRRNNFEKARSPLKKTIVSSPLSDDHRMSPSRLPRQKALGNLSDVLSSPAPGPLSSLFEVHCDEEQEQEEEEKIRRNESPKIIPKLATTKVDTGIDSLAMSHRPASVKKNPENTDPLSSPRVNKTLSLVDNESSPCRPPTIDMERIFDDCLFSENEKGKMLMEFAKNVPDEHLDKTFADWIKYVAILAEEEVSNECDRLVDIIKAEQEKARQYIMALPTVEA